jgi:Tol biopolymer transport system component
MRVRKVLMVALAVLLLGTGAVAALPRVADDLPMPLAAVAHLSQRLWTHVFPPRLAQSARLSGLTGSEQEAGRILAGRLAARIVWSSNRSGNHELYLLDLGEPGRARSIKRLTDHPNVDFFSRFSPDGRQIVFLRSQRAWVSFRDPTAWDVMLINVDGTGEQRLAIGGYHPTWTADGRAIVFQRGMRVMRYGLTTRREELLLDAAREFSRTGELGDAEVSPDGQRLAFSLRGRFTGAYGLQGAFSGAAVFDLTGRTLAVLTKEQACQTTWAPDGQRVVWIETGGHGGTRVMTGQPDGVGREVFADLPGSYSHEYFPKFSNDGRWLIWGASNGGHEHDRADYEIFLWQAGTPIEQAVRLTHHEANDQWPDLFVHR